MEDIIYQFVGVAFFGYLSWVIFEELPKRQMENRGWRAMLLVGLYVTATLTGQGLLEIGQFLLDQQSARFR